MKLYLKDVKEYTEEEANNILSSNENTAQLHFVDLNNININTSKLLFEQYKNNYIMIRTEVTIDNKRFILCAQFYYRKHWFKEDDKYMIYGLPYRIKDSAPIKEHPILYSEDELINNKIEFANTNDRYNNILCYYVIDNNIYPMRLSIIFDLYIRNTIGWNKIPQCNSNYIM